MKEYMASHYIHRSNWLRAAVLGANDGILSTTSLAIGVAAASSSKEPVILATVAGLVAGALSMAAGEYVSVGSQTDVEEAELEREKHELKESPEQELLMLAKIYEQRGLSRETSMFVAKELSQKNALAAHARDELGINEMTKAKPVQAAFSSAAAFIFGGGLPLLVTLFCPLPQLQYVLYGSAIVFLVALGALAAQAGGSSIRPAVIRIVFWGTVAMGLTSLVGTLFGVHIA